ncbi:helix-turn-helix domain-containing protein [Litorilinea aerophila]|uniref:PucR family transcriptional regulator n=1 Tax=Litorilinea aerophila TaxID=1204385 RepID=A0A540VFT9_9CHLR|nr:helix-turn-helix domain-containing protein [Litorilinea aerophila]MCC9076626.1 helix-turn-helix domain-containing protein [Litorilinea aerophila]
MYKNTATIEDIYRLALPPGTELLTGGEYLNRTVSWACSLRPSPPAFPKLDGNELALIDMEDLRRLDPNMRLDRVVRSLQDARIAAVAVQGEFHRAAVDVARAARIPLFRLPDDVPLIQVERAVIRLIVDRAGYIAQRSAELQRELNQIALDGGGMEEIARHIHQFLQQPIVVLREDGEVAAMAGLESLPEGERHAVTGALPNMMALRSWAVTQPTHTLSQAVGVLPMLVPAGGNGGETGGFREAVVAPILANESVRGFCLVLRGENHSLDVTAVEEIAVLQGAAAAALEWAKQNAIGIAEERMRAAFLDELLAAEIADEQAWIQRGASLKFDLTRPHVAWMVEAHNVPDWPTPLLRFVEKQGITAPYSRREEGILLFWPIDNPKSGRELKAVANEFVNQIQARYPKARLVIGIGRPAVGPARWLQSQQQARESWRLGKEWKGAPVTYFGDLGLYQLLTALGNNPEAARFFRKTLGRLILHDDNRNAELVDTLEAFFECHGNLSQTANRLHIHRNTLTYRLERIANITQLDLNDPDARFSLQLALKLRPLMKG